MSNLPKRSGKCVFVLHPKSSACCLTNSTCQKGERESEREREILVLPAGTKARFLSRDLTGVNMACKLHQETGKGAWAPRKMPAPAGKQIFMLKLPTRLSEVYLDNLKVKCKGYILHSPEQNT